MQDKIDYIHNFCKAQNAATGSDVDANANVTNKDIAVMESELNKDFMIQYNRGLVTRKMKELYGQELVDAFNDDLHNHLIYVHDETTLKPYCVSVSLYPFLLEGTKPMGGTSKSPTNLRSFCGSFCNLIYQIASGFAGAVATVEFLMYFDYFARKDFGNLYLHHHSKEIAQELQGVVYTMNQPAAARGNQSVFWNISIFDKHYFDAIFGDFVFPDGTKPDYDSLKALQVFFLDWFREERTKELLTFPVLTAAYLVDEANKEPKDTWFSEVLARSMSEGLSFFHYESTSADSLSSCCRLRNELADNTFSYTLGAGGVSTGSFQVITINLVRAFHLEDLDILCERLHKYLNCYREVIKDFLDAHMLPAYDAGYINLSKQFGTIGINGALECFEEYYQNSRPLEKKDIPNYTTFLKSVLQIIKDHNTSARKIYGYSFNTEFVPAETLGVKNCAWDKRDGFYHGKRDCYNSYFFPVENGDFDVLTKFKLHGQDVSQYLDGGAACHVNLEEIPDFKQCLRLIKIAAVQGVPYWTTNVLTTICKDCGRIDPSTLNKCPHCGSTNVEYATRVIGYLKPISSFSEARQHEAGLRYYNKLKD